MKAENKHMNIQMCTQPPWNLQHHKKQIYYHQIFTVQNLIILSTAEILF